jgi:LPXTG-site transpeptidase (sortase) family protein
VQSVILRCKMINKEIGSLLIILGYVILVSGTVAIVRDWLDASTRSNPSFDDVPALQGFVPILDYLEPFPQAIEIEASLLNPGASAASPARLSSLETWQVSPSLQNSPSTGASNQEGSDPNQPVWIPDHMMIPAIRLDVPIEASQSTEVEILDVTYRQWLAPDSRTVGWQPLSASLGAPGNTVLIGHHNIDGEVFRDLDKLEVGDQIEVFSGEKIFEYRVLLKMILPEKYESIETRLENARWIQPTQDERLTLVTCWPYETNTHRLILVAEPVDWEALGTRENHRIGR